MAMFENMSPNDQLAMLLRSMGYKATTDLEEKEAREEMDRANSFEGLRLRSAESAPK